MNTKEYELEVNGAILKAAFTDLADQANGSVLISYRNTTILVTACMSKKEKDGDFFPLTVDFEERFYAAGKILGSRFIRREGRPSDESILAGRVVDRTIRPLFDQHIRFDIQVIVTAISIGDDDPDILSVIGASLALGTSNIPWNGPVSAVRIAKIGEEFKINPTYAEREDPELTLDLTACGKDGNINMIEVAAKEISNELADQSLALASKEIEKIQAWQKQIISEIGKPKREFVAPKMPDEVVALFEKEIRPKFKDVIFSGPGKEAINNLKEEWVKISKENLPEIKSAFFDEHFEIEIDKLIHEEAIKNQKRPDGRNLDEVRPLFAKAGGVSSMLHGSGIFYRGGTHVFSALTLGGPGDTQVIDNMEMSTKKRFMHHYNFPSFSTGETGRSGGLSRRAVGHGYLAEKALIPVIPSKEDFPYTIRVVSESLASNGSTSMGSVCAASLALMDGGVPIKSPVAGIASGLMMKNKDEYALLTDIQGPEDHHGDMDFKVAGTRTGITAIQMDVKVDGIPLKILSGALVKAENARLHILETIEKELGAPRKEISEHAPKILTIKINPDFIGLVIGTGGKTIREISEKTGATLEIEEDGTVFITGKNGSAEEAKKIVEDMTHEYKQGEKYQGEVVRIVEFGAFVRIGHDAEGLVHVSEMAPFRVDNVRNYLKEGDIVPVVVKEIDEKNRISLSIKQANPDFLKKK